MAKHRTKKIFILLGILSPLFIFLMVSILSLAVDGYDFVDGYVSFLGSSTSPVKDVINIFGFGLFGIIMIGLGYHFMEIFNNYYGKFASRLFMGAGLLLFLLAFFPIDPKLAASTFDGRTHSVIGNLIFIMWPLSMIAFGLSFRKREDWGQLWMISSFILAAVSLTTSSILKLTPAFGGVIERVGMGADLLWMFLVSLNVFFQDQQLKLKNFVDHFDINFLKIYERH